MVATRAFEREGLLARTVPFIGVAVGAAAILPFQTTVEQRGLVQGAAIVAALVAAIFAVPWMRLPRWTDIIVPLAFLVAVALLRNAEGGRTATTGSLVLLPVVWFGLYGTGREVAVGVAFAVAVFVVPVLLIGGQHYPPRELSKAANLSMVASMIGFVVHRLVAGRAVLSAEVARRADIDSLTGLPNRGVWIRRLDDAVAHAQSHAEHLCVAILDLDGLKAINDLGGHVAGDQALTDAAAAWSAACPSAATLARLGGDEFGLILPGLSEEDASAELETMRQAALPRAASIGLARFTSPESARALLSRADQALYAAKDSGRNRTGVATGQVIAELQAREGHVPRRSWHLPEHA